MDKSPDWDQRSHEHEVLADGVWPANDNHWLCEMFVCLSSPLWLNNMTWTQHEDLSLHGFIRVTFVSGQGLSDGFGDSGWASESVSGAWFAEEGGHKTWTIKAWCNGYLCVCWTWEPGRRGTKSIFNPPWTADSYELRCHFVMIVCHPGISCSRLTPGQSASLWFKRNLEQTCLWPWFICGYKTPIWQHYPALGL